MRQGRGVSRILCCKRAGWLLACGALGALFLAVTRALAGDVEVPINAQVVNTLEEESSASMSLGTIPLNPLGDSVTMNARQGGTGAQPLSAKGVPIAGGSVGAVTITASGPFAVTASMPDTAIMTGTIDPTATITLTDIQDNSLHDILVPSTGTGEGSDTHSVTIAIGGKLDLPVGTKSDTYTGLVPVLLEYSEPP